MRFVEVTGHLGQQFVRCHTDRAAQARFVLDALLDAGGQRTSAILLYAGQFREVDEHFIDPAVLHHRRLRQDDGLETP